MCFGARGSFFTTMTPSLKRCSRIAFFVFFEMRTIARNEKKCCKRAKELTSQRAL